MKMKRIAPLLLLAVFAVVASAAPAFAQKDPFDPLVTQSDEAPGETSSGTSTTGGGAFEEPGDDAVAPTRPESLPNTGPASLSWTAVAYVLIAAGGALLLLVRLGAPAARTARHRS